MVRCDWLFIQLRRHVRDVGATEASVGCGLPTQDAASEIHRTRHPVAPAKPRAQPPPVVPAYAGTQRRVSEGATASPTKKVSSLPRTHVFSGFAAVRSDGVAYVGRARLRHCSQR